MRVAFFSPLPPSRTGIADYSEALLAPLRGLAEVEVFSQAPRAFDPPRYDVALYQVGNNPHHAFVYEAALEHPGVVVLHESNLHHLIADITIRRGDWDAYLREAEYNGGTPALEYARRVRSLECGPDYEGVAMNRRLLERSRGVIVHSRFLEREVRQAGFSGPLARIPHGAWLAPANPQAHRHRLGLDETEPLVGIFGFLKPYKRIAESLRAFKRLQRLAPRVKMILVGEPHPEARLDSLIRTLELSAHVRLLGFTPAEDFAGYMAACDIVLNLRHPTAGESSGSLMRALGLGKPVLVSDLGAFAELPEDVCLKVPVDAAEEDLIFEYLNVLVSRPDAARALGARAKDWAARECSWERVAARYASFLEAVAAGRDGREPERTEPAETAASASPPVPIEYVAGWAPGPESRQYVDTHRTRLEKTLSLTPPGTAPDRILEMGAYLQITPALKTRLGYGTVRGCYYGVAGDVDRRRAVSSDGEVFDCEIDLFDAERDRFPYEDEYFSTVLCCELIEHLREDPMRLMVEVNRILKPGGHLVLTTPNIASLRGIAAILQGFHPGIFPAYVRPRGTQETEARHNREYAPREIRRLLEDAGFSVTRLETGPFQDAPHPEDAWVLKLLERYNFESALRGEGIYAVGRKTGGVRDRYPSWLYS